MKAIPDNFPTVSVGIKYGQYVDNFDPDIAAITERMKSAGLTDEQIAETNILFSDKPYPRRNKIITYGSHDGSKKQIVVYGLEDIIKLSSRNKTMAEYVQGAMGETLAHELEHRIASFDTLQQALNKKYYNKLAFKWRTIAFGVGGIALGYGINQVYADYVHHNNSLIEATAIAGLTYFAVRKAEDKIFSSQIHDEYYQSPEEIRARAAAKQSNDLISMSVKDTPQSDTKA